MRLPKPLALAFLGTLSLAGAIACQAPVADEADVSEGQLTSSPRKGEEFVRCWTTSDGNADDFFRTYDLTCRVSSAGLPGLAGSSVFVDARTAGNNVRSGRPGETPDQDVLIGRLSKSDFPLNIRVYGSWGSTRTSSITAYRINVPATVANTAAAPVIVKLPFDTWPVKFLNRLPLAVVTSTAYDVDVAPFITQQDERSTKTTFAPGTTSGIMRDVPRFDLDFIAPKTGGITVQVQGPNPSYRATISAPGTYVIESSGLRLATAAEEAEAGATPATPAADGGAAAADAGPAPVDPAPAPAPTCGDPTQAPCTASGSSSCNAGTRYDSSTGKCVACGDDGETYCFLGAGNMSGSSSCNAGTRYDSNTGKCVACGNAGQTYCFVGNNNMSGSSSCNAGTRYDSNTGKCVACGNAGQTYCFAGNNNMSGSTVCNPGLRLSNGICVM